MLNSEPQRMLLLQKPCNFLSFCLISLKLLMLENCLRYKRVSIEIGSFKKRQKRLAIFSGRHLHPPNPRPPRPPITPLYHGDKQNKTNTQI